jgi:hypothetical protein
VIEASPTLRGCQLESSAAGTAATPGAGGGGFFWRSSPRLEHCIVRGNAADRGAGLFLLRCDAVLDGVIVEANDAGGTGRGAGVGALASRLELRGGRVSANFGAQDGGGLHLDGCDRVRFDRLEIDSNSASRHGAGVATRASRLEALASRLVRNHAGDRGGGVHADGDSIVLESCVVGANSAAAIGGGLYLAARDARLVNVTVAGNRGGSAGGVYWTDAAAAGDIRACTIADNGVGGVVLGTGTPPRSDWNLFWKNGGQDRVAIAAGSFDLEADPRFVAPGALDFGLGLGSPALDTGDPAAARADRDGSRNDRGAHGGPGAFPAAPARPVGVEALLESEGVRVRWRTSPGSWPESFAVHRDSIAGFLPSDANRLAVVPVDLTEWFDSTPRLGCRYVIVAIDAAGHASGASLAVGSGTPSDVESGAARLALHGVVPNPASPGTWIDYELPSADVVQLEVFTASGARVRLLAQGREAGGRRRVHWDGRDDRGHPVPSGVYWVRLQTFSQHRSRKLVVVR